VSRIDTFLELAVKQGGSDLHLVSGQAPRIRIHGVLHRVRFRELSVQDLRGMIEECMPEQLRERIDSTAAVDFAYSVEGLGRFRVNVFKQLHGIAAALRVIPDRIPSLDDLGLPQSVKLQASQPKGLVLVTGPTGSGKSTTLAAMIDHINTTRRGHVITLEDPIEFVHSFKQCVVSQREIHVHARSLADALRDTVREDPDVILVGELRDPEAIAHALSAAETGVQVLGTLHTSGASRSIDRVLNVFPGPQQEQVRSMLADSLSMIISQKLLRTADGSKRVAAAEVLVNNHAARTIIRTGNSHKLQSVMQSGARVGMQSFTAALKDLVRNGTITPQEAYEHATDKSSFENLAPQMEMS
jgi:twitching motility protein PilT